MLMVTTKAMMAGVLMAAFASTPLLAQTQRSSDLDIAPRASTVIQPQAIAGMRVRYLLTEMRSIESLAGNVTTSIRITNMSGRACSYGIEFYYSAGVPSPACTISIPKVASFDTVYACSRTNSNPLGTSCGQICNPALTGIAGKARIYSTNSVPCEAMAVNATIVNSTANDAAIVTMRTPKIVKYDTTELNRTNRGD